MISDRLYEYAFAYKKTKLWKVLFDSDLFALRLSDGSIGYVSIMGKLGEYCALALYIGEEGIDTFFTAAEADEFQMSPLDYQEHLMSQNCLQCAFDKKDELAREEQEEVKQYARDHGIRLSGRNAYPMFFQYLPNHIPWQLQTDEEQKMLCEALEAAIEMARLLEKNTPKELGFIEEGRPNEIPFLEKKGNTYVLGKTALPEKKPKQWPSPEITNDIMAANLKKNPRKGVWECKIVRFPEAVKEPEEDIPVFPVILLAIDTQTEYLLPVSPVCYYEEQPQKLLDLFLDTLQQQKICPKELKVQEERTYAFAENLCKKLGISLTMEEQLPFLEEVEYDFFNHFGGNNEEEIETVMGFLYEMLNMTKDQIRQFPPEILSQIESLIGQEVLPLELERELRQLLPGEKPKKTGDRIISFSKNLDK
ncbi:MAG: hypothetical protein HFI76_03580 [Lachnospiraceae bacterium]|nr:hypothetical protein [Lachnospiraceae bacterium]